MSGIVYPEWGSAPRSSEVYEDRYHRGEVLDRVSTPHGDFTVVRCEPCVLTHVVPLPSADELAAYYRETFWQQDKAGHIERYREDEAWWRMQYAYLFDWTGQPPGEVLDIGIGAGIFLNLAQERGWKTWGIEPHEGLATQAEARGHRMLMDTFPEREPLPAGSFDFIHAHEVLEHSPDPQEFMLHCWELLKPGGVVAVTVPFDYSSLQLLACEQLQLPRYWLAPPQHLNYFTPKCLQLLLRRSGLTIGDLRGTFPLEQFLLMGDNYINDDHLGRICHHKRVAYEISFFEKGLIELLYNSYRANMEYPYSGAMGREIVIVARKE